MALPTLVEAIEALPAFTRLANTLPGARATVTVGGLHGSSDAVLLAALARRFPQRLFVVLAAGVPEAERWLADLDTLLDRPAEGGAPVALYPHREAFGEAEPHAEVAGERVETLERLTRGGVRILLTTPRAVLERTRLPRALQQARLELRRGDVWRPEDLAAHLERVGFTRVAMVDDIAQFSVRGGIFDIYGFGMAEPVRLEFWGDEISELRHFDLFSQRSTRAAEVAVVLPVDGALAGEGTEFERVTLADLWTPDTLLFVADGLDEGAELQRTWDEAAHHLELARRRGEDVPKREALFLEPSEARGLLKGFGTLREIAPDKAGGATPEIGFPLRAPDAIDRDIRKLRRLVRDGMTTLILCDNEGQAERLDELLGEKEDDFVGRQPSPAALVIGVLGGGFVVPAGADALGRNVPGLRVLTDHEIFRRDRRIRRARRYSAGTALDAVTGLKPGDFVVHLEHGVGIYRGIETKFVGTNTIEVAVVEYEGGDKLNVPLYRLDQIERYRAAGDGDADAPPPRLHRLGGKRWQAQRDKTRAAIQEMTVELLELYARRRVAARPPHNPDGAWQRQLESSFLFEDTPDQRKATEDVKKDMESGRPMDRLLVGDVGYGKTEIAVRAAFKAVQSGRQVAVLVPTTILADQHHRTFSERFADFPVRVEMLSRFQTAKEQAGVMSELAAGKVDVIIGTHRLLSPDITFNGLGLIIVDEEHRFGVKHKERLKQLKLETDVLTLTATPIPRTLHQSLAGLRDMTLMQTAPRDRSPVLTFVEPKDDGLVEEGIARELDRGGQVFYVHNRVETIEAVADHLRRIVPRARIAVGHGQMREKDLEDVMHRFVSHDVDILVSTLIVETGLDVPNANTMFVNNAHHFGLAQLYQLRGRVGRSHRRAYCYLLVPDAVDEDAERRLSVLEHHTELGAGYRVALKDMELRGAGNLLGPEQSGFVHAVGFDMYLRMLDETVRRLIAGDVAPRLVPSDVSLDQAAYLPDDYVVSQEAKLDLYRRLGATTTAAEIDALRDEVRDRFGALPPQAEAFFATAYLRVLGGALGVEGVLVRGDEARVTFRDTAVPRMKALGAAFHDVQFQAEVKRAQPLSLKLARLGGAEILPGLVRALRSLVPA
ncbi:transcription-repair coupling factor [Roseisolibacter agri]|uniref:Transcription-repair-coupling factor n=1 Tax=Roseisolibacter agri TaxID=2014610 RepID=A0AA37QLP3_9BACT|nr:transcription-repair coupling factor [Roseisolibacter agri]GLC28133.1 transcription-repair-coupling factor [Roseisolibacter agri]